MDWALLALAGVFEVAFTSFLKLSDGFRRIGYTLAFVAAAAASFWLLTLALPTVPLGTAYAVWTGIGAVGTAVVGMMAFHEPATFWRIFFLTVLIAAIAGLRFVS
jgi:quaternary ammonium compound-resistance protein SugE